jgi:hypothetical protein
MSLGCRIGIALGYCRDGVDDDDIRRTTLHSFVLPVALEKCGEREKRSFVKTGFRGRANSISDLDKSVFDARRNILIWFSFDFAATRAQPPSRNLERGRAVRL